MSFPLKLFEDYKYKIFNEFAHDATFKEDGASGVLLRFYVKAQKGTLKPTYGASDISVEDAKVLEHNLSKLTIRIIPLSEHPLTVEFIKSSVVF